MVRKIYNCVDVDGIVVEFDNKKLLGLSNLCVAGLKEQFCLQLRNIRTISIPEEDMTKKSICDEVYNIRKNNDGYDLIFTNTNSGEIEDKIMISPEELKILLHCPKASKIDWVS